jgi:hypothetical protein
MSRVVLEWNGRLQCFTDLDVDVVLGRRSGT